MDERANTSVVATRPPKLICGRASVIEGATLLVVTYCLVGVGLGAVFGAAMLGLVVAAGAGIVAVAAVLLISGASAVAPLSAAPRSSPVAPSQRGRQPEEPRLLAGSRTR